MRQLLCRFIREEDGQDLIEYAFLAVFIALGVIIGLQAIAVGLNQHFTNVGSQVGAGS
jgi:Flp pilus assembly pilin Flp